MIILRDSNYTGTYTADYLVRSGFKVFGKVGNKYVALQMPYDVVSSSIEEVIVERVVKEPLYKQAMALQMGRLPADKVERKRYRFYPVSEKNINKYHYEIMGASFV